jgi:hypothetical protein
MKTITSSLTLSGLFTIIMFVACSKGDHPVSYNTLLLVEKGWKFEFYGLDENNNGAIDESENAMQACEADDVFTFNVNGTGLLNRGTTTCSQGETTIANFNWTFSNNETELAIFASPEKISVLDENTLEVYYMDQNLQGQSVRFVRRFRH